MVSMAVFGRSTERHVAGLAGNILRVARAQLGLTQRELADRAGTAQSTIARIESGSRQPSLPVLARILAAVDLELRINLAAYDDHDDVLDATEDRLDADQREARRKAQDAFAAALRRGVHHDGGRIHEDGERGAD